MAEGKVAYTKLGYEGSGIAPRLLTSIQLFEFRKRCSEHRARFGKPSEMFLSALPKAKPLANTEFIFGLRFVVLDGKYLSTTFIFYKRPELHY